MQAHGIQRKVAHHTQGLNDIPCPENSDQSKPSGRSSVTTSTLSLSLEVEALSFETNVQSVPSSSIKSASVPDRRNAVSFRHHHQGAMQCHFSVLEACLCRPMSGQARSSVTG